MENFFVEGIWLLFPLHIFPRAIWSDKSQKRQIFPNIRPRHLNFSTELTNIGRNFDLIKLHKSRFYAFYYFPKLSIFEFQFHIWQMKPSSYPTLFLHPAKVAKKIKVYKDAIVLFEIESDYEQKLLHMIKEGLTD